MNSIIERLVYLIEQVPIRIKQFSESQISEKKPGKWSRKEVLGHLCDSAANNHHRFVRIQFEKQPFEVSSYDQNNWVEVQDYQNSRVEDILNLWVSLNKHLVRIVSRIPEEQLMYLCQIGSHEPVTLRWLIQDYLSHMEHHLEQIFGTADV